MLVGISNPNIESDKVETLEIDEKANISLSVDLDMWLNSIYFFRQKNKLYMGLYSYITSETHYWFNPNAFYGGGNNTNRDRLTPSKIIRNNYKVILKHIVDNILGIKDLDYTQLKITNDIKSNANDEDSVYFEVLDISLYNKLISKVSSVLKPHYRYTVKYIISEDRIDVKRGMDRLYRIDDDKTYSDPVAHMYTNEIEVSMAIPADSTEVEKHIKYGVDLIKEFIDVKTEYFSKLQNTIAKEYPVNINVVNEKM